MKLQFSTFLIAFFFILNSSFSQGLILDPNAYSSTETWEPDESFGFSLSDLPSSISYRKYAPYPQHQGLTGTCVGYAVGYGQMTTLQNILMGETNIFNRSIRSMDPFFLFGLIRNTNDKWCQNGADFDDAMSVLSNYGNKPRHFEPLMNCNETSKYNDFSMSVASMYKIDEFLSVPKDDFVNNVKKALYYGLPVSIGVFLTESFENGSSMNYGYWKPRYDEEITGGHAMLVVGYDNSKNGGSFEVLNSWGSEFGDNGYVWIKYSDFVKRVAEAYVIGYEKDLFRNERCSMGDCYSYYSRYRFNNSTLDVYEGGMKNGYPDIYGSMIYKNGDYYAGDWKQGRKHGYGITYKKAFQKWYIQQYKQDVLVDSEAFGFSKDAEKEAFLKKQYEVLNKVFPGDLVDEIDSPDFEAFEDQYEVPENPVKIDKK